MVESVEAKALDTDLAVVKVDQQKVTDLIIEMDAEIRKCNAVVAEFEGSTLADASTDDVKRLSQDLSRHYRDADEARKRFKREWQEPQKAVEAAFKEALAPMKELVDEYKGELDARNAATRQERYEDLCAVYEQSAPEIADIIPIESFGVVREKVSVAKDWETSGKRKAVAGLMGGVERFYADLDAVRSSGLEFQQEAENELFKTLSLQAALSKNAELAERRRQVERFNAEMGIAPEPEPEPDPMPEPEPQPEPMQQPEPEQAAAQPSELVGRYCIVCDMTPAQKHGLLGYMRAEGIHGHINTIRKENANG